MNLTLHTTYNCNLKCRYCFVDHSAARMDKETAFAAVRFSMQNCTSSGLLFYGGEPLLERTLIEDTIAYCKEISKDTGHAFHYKITTNGTLLDEAFIQSAKRWGLKIGFSHDGPAQDICRVFHDGSGSAGNLENTFPLLLTHHPYAIGMSVMDPSTIHLAYATVKFLFDKGFRYITQSLNYSREATWTEKHFAILKKEYEKMASLYIKWTRAEEKFYLSPFDLKIISHIKGKDYIPDRLKHANNQTAVAPDGKIYTGPKYVGNPNFEIGDVFMGIDQQKSEKIYKMLDIIPETCTDCALSERCNYVYEGIPAGGDGTIREISPVQCAHEQLLTPIADYVAETLYKEKNPMFMHKHYNKMYPFLSMVEDFTVV